MRASGKKEESNETVFPAVVFESGRCDQTGSPEECISGAMDIL